MASLYGSISKFEGRPNAVLEATAVRCPLLVSDIPAHREFLDDATALFVSQYDDARNVGQAIIGAINDGPTATRPAEHAFERVKQMSVSAISDQFEAMYYNVLRSRPRENGRIWKLFGTQKRGI